MKIKLELFVEEVNLILQALGNMPYAQVKPMIEKIHEMATPQVQAQEPENSLSEDEGAGLPGKK